MNYQDTVSWMFQQLPMYQKIGSQAYKKDLSNTITFSEYLKKPHQKFKSIHVAGTNGKGSTSHMLASILQEAGYKVGLYTSPHLKDFRERIRINGKEVSKQFVIGFIRRHKSFILSNKLSFFEMTVGMAFEYFSKKAVDIAIIEVGMGGRLDSTNIISPVLSVITNIGLDHTQFLGNTIAQIAKEKAGIIKADIPVVIGETHEESCSVFTKISDRLGSELYFADQLVTTVYDCDLRGAYQYHNIKTVTQSVRVLRDNGFDITESDLKKGLLKVSENTGIKGRWQVLQDNPKIVCDTAHNQEGLKIVMEQLSRESFRQLHIIFGVVKDKNLKSILPLLPKEAIFYYCKPDVPRGLDVRILEGICSEYGFSGSIYNSVKQALNSAKRRVEKDDLIYIGGSTFVVAEVI